MMIVNKYSFNNQNDKFNDLAQSFLETSLR